MIEIKLEPRKDKYLGHAIDRNGGRYRGHLVITVPDRLEPHLKAHGDFPFYAVWPESRSITFFKPA